MKFLDIQWWSGCQSDGSDDAAEQWRAHHEKLRPQLPPDVVALLDAPSIHDATLRSLEIAATSATLTLCLYDGRPLSIIYGGLLRFESAHTPKLALHGSGGYGDLGYYELHRTDDGAFEHRLLFSTSIELRFTFATVRLVAG